MGTTLIFVFQIKPCCPLSLAKYQRAHCQSSCSRCAVLPSNCLHDDRVFVAVFFYRRAICRLSCARCAVFPILTGSACRGDTCVVVPLLFHVLLLVHLLSC